MRVGSLFSGVGGFDLGLERAGFEVAFQCDNDPFCNKVLAHHWPGAKRYDDVRDISNTLSLRGRDAAPDTTDLAPDLICGGFPCQDLSLAGKRAGLDGGRSGLWFEFKRILSELRPQWAIIENVPGLLSSNQGRDFAVVLDGLGECGFAGISWAVLDSQHFGVAQRRRRVYVVAGPSRRSVEQVLSLCEGCGGYHPTRRTPREDVAATIRGRSSSAGVNEPGRGGEDDPNLVLAKPLLTHLRHNAGDENYIAHHQRYDLDNETYIPVVSHTLNAKGGSGRSDYESETMGDHSLLARFDAREDGTGRGTPLTVIQDARGHDKAQNGLGIEQSETMYTLDGASQHAVHTSSVRRLTPTECERLQGFPDHWTDVGGAADGPRYKALGNAVSVPVIEYLGLRIAAFHGAAP